MKLIIMLLVSISCLWSVVLVSCQLGGNGGTKCQGTECELDLESNSRTMALLENATITIATALPRLVQVLEDNLKGNVSVNNGSCNCTITSVKTEVAYPKDCTEVAARGNITSGYYTIKPISPKAVYEDLDQPEDKSIDVYCDMDSDDGGWTVFQRRQNGAVGFNQDWNAYKHGFGYLNGDFWMGLDMLHKIALGRHELRVDLQDFSGNRAYARYDHFTVGDEESFYTLVLGDYEGTAGDGLSYHNGSGFSTKDQDHDNYSGQCAVTNKGAWWYKSCHHSNLNGLYMGPSQISNEGMSWHSWKTNWEVLKASEMKVRHSIRFKKLYLQ